MRVVGDRRPAPPRSVPMPVSPSSRLPFVVLKFGGTSVARAERWRIIGTLASRRLEEGLQPVLVCSALSGVSDALVRLLDEALEGAHAPLLASLRATHQNLADALGVDLPPAVGAQLEFLARMAEGVYLVGEVSPRLRARVLACGELMSTALGVAALQAQGLDAVWVDVREHLTTTAPAGTTRAQRYLQAHCTWAADPALQTAFSSAGTVVVTQGFIARQPDTGDTALLGRGGSDTSAAILAARLLARRCEIWTDVPGLFTANPKAVPSARLLRSVDYAEAQEIASMGAKVLHPRCVAPVHAAGIPLSVHCTPRPELPGSQIGGGAATGPGLKAVASRSGVTLVSMDTVGMWQKPGFLAEAFAIFADLSLSIDLVATSESSVTVTLDSSGAAPEVGVLETLLTRLNAICKAEARTNLAAVSLVGRGIRAILHRLAPVFELFEEQRIHLLSQAANDLNLTVVVDQDQADRLVQQLHGVLLTEVEGASWLGATWSALMEPKHDAVPVSTARPTWWSRARGALLAEAERGTPAYVYAGPEVTAAARRLKSLRTPSAVLYAMKANPHPDVLRRVVAEGLGIECVSPEEVRRGRAALDEGGSSAPLLFTPNFAHRDEYVAGFAAGAFVTLDNLHPLAAWPEVFAGRSVFVRIDPGGGAGHHAHVRTAGARSKFGVSQEQLPALVALCEQHDVTVVGLHAHVGSGIRDPRAWERTGTVLAGIITAFFPESVRTVDLGGGLGVVEKPGQVPLDLAAFDASLASLQALLPAGCALWLEPGRYVVSEAGVLLARVTQRKRKGPIRYVGVDVGMNSLIRPALYGAWHDIVNLSQLGATSAWEEVDVVGPICETGDVLGRARRLQEPREGDVILIGTAGAYGRAMSSSYNLRAPAREVVLDTVQAPETL